MSFTSDRGMEYSVCLVLEKLFHSATGGDGGKQLPAKTWRHGAV
jgi:hypothetical protein